MSDVNVILRIHDQKGLLNVPAYFFRNGTAVPRLAEVRTSLCVRPFWVDLIGRYAFITYVKVSERTIRNMCWAFSFLHIVCCTTKESSFCTTGICSELVLDQVQQVSSTNISLWISSRFPPRRIIICFPLNRYTASSPGMPQRSTGMNSVRARCRAVASKERKVARTKSGTYKVIKQKKTTVD
jgi:hypothetical protein